ncbi:MAG: DUF3108 domain-containing protein [Bacteroidota bacterium]
MVVPLLTLSPGGDGYHQKPSVNVVASGLGPGVFSVGEELIYNVRYLFFTIGEIRVRVTGRLEEDGRKRYKTVAYIDSSPGLPFVDLHRVFESVVSQGFYSQGFLGRGKTRDGWSYVEYEFDDSARTVIIQKGELPSNRVTHLDTVHLKRYPYQDGFSLFYYARSGVGSGIRETIPTLIDKDTVNTSFHFHSVRSKIEIGAVEYPIDAVQVRGTAEFVGVYGMTGEFRGWFTNDEARVPVLAFIKVILGNVKIELKEWTRAGWSPPRFPVRSTE